MSLRYFGSKDWLKKYVECLLPPDLDVLVSPFFGSGRVEYYVAMQRPDVKVLGSDSFAPLTNFHKCVQEDSELVAADLKRFMGKPLSRKQYDGLLERVEDNDDQYQRAAAFFVIMHNSYHGKFGSYFVNTPPFTDRALLKIHKHSLPNVKVKKADVFAVFAGLAARLHGQRVVLYLDPPYLRLHDDPSEFYYAKKAQGDNFDFHVRLAKAVRQSKVPFIMSLNDTAEVRKLYDREKVVTLSRTYRTTRKDKKGSELLIFGPRSYWSKRFDSARCSLGLIARK
jgi:DNA adenine methylase